MDWTWAHPHYMSILIPIIFFRLEIVLMCLNEILLGRPNEILSRLKL